MAPDPAFEALCAVAAKQRHVVLRGQALAAGITPDRWTGGLNGRLQPLLRGTAMVLTPTAPLAPTVHQWAASALLVSPRNAALCMGSSLRIAGVVGTPQHDPEHVLLPTTHGWRARAGLVRHGFVVEPADIVTLAGMRTTGLPRSLHDAMRTYDWEHAVSVLDSALALGHLFAAETDYLEMQLPGERRGWVRLADARAESPLETRGRLFLVDRALPFESQVAIQVPGYGSARADFRVGKRVLVECDGRTVHDELSARYLDRKREDALRQMGFEVVRVTWGDLLLRPEETYLRICAALTRVG